MNGSLRRKNPIKISLNQATKGNMIRKPLSFNCWKHGIIFLSIGTMQTVLLFVTSHFHVQSKSNGCPYFNPQDPPHSFLPQKKMGYSAVYQPHAGEGLCRDIHINHAKNYWPHVHNGNFHSRSFINRANHFTVVARWYHTRRNIYSVFFGHCCSSELNPPLHCWLTTLLI